MTESPAGSFVDDRPGVFRVRRGAFVEPALFERELDRIFARCWNYVCHESQLRERGSYVRGTIGRFPVFAIRGLDGEIRCFHDSCPHRGSMLTRGGSGVQPTITCRYHGWAFNADGKCIRVRGRDEGYSREALERLGTDLKPVARVALYRGFVFACLDAEVEDLESFLGGARPFIDLMADQSERGMEVLKGESTYVMRANWKLQTENSTDGYHVATVHRNFAHAVRQREALAGETGDARARTEASRILDLQNIQSGGYDVGNGHMINWSDRGSPESAPLNEARAALVARFGPRKARWMIDRGRTVTIFPNFFLNDVASTCIRLWRPVAVDLTEIDTWCLAPIGESAEARRARIRKYEDFFLPSSLAVPDDVRAMEVAHAGSLAAGGNAWNDLALGRATMIAGADDAARARRGAALQQSGTRERDAVLRLLARVAAPDGPAVSFDAALTAEAADLLHREAWHLDRREWEAWLALYAEDAVYWAPALAGEEGFSEDPDNDVSLIYLDRAGLEARIFRIEGGDSFASAPLPHTAHLVSNVRAVEAGGAKIEVSATWLVNSFRRTDPPILRAGRYAYVLRRDGERLKIARKTVFVLDDRIVGPIDIFNI